MTKKIVLLALLCGLLSFNSSCALLTKTFDRRTHFSEYLEQLENSIKSEDWNKAESLLESSKKAWKQLKPLIQVDVDHDYVNSIEENLVMLSGYIETSEKPDSLAAVRMIKDMWENIGSL